MCGSKSHLIKDSDYHEQRMSRCGDSRKSRPMWTNVNDIPPYVPQAANYNTSFPWRRPVVKPYVQPTSEYLKNGFWPRYVNPMTDGRGYWDTAVKTSAGCSWNKQRPKFHWKPKNNSGSYTSTWHNSYDPQGRFKSAMT